MTTPETKVFQILREKTELLVLLCDDDTDFLSKTESTVARILDKLCVKAQIASYNGFADIPLQQLTDCHIAILDIDLQQDEANGIHIARRIRQTNPLALILFVTNFIEYAPEGYEVQAFRYLLKRDMDEVMERYLMEALEQLSGKKEILQLQCGGAIVDLAFQDILYLEVLQHSVTLYVQEKNTVQTYTVTASLSSFEQQLERHDFLRIHKSYLVNMRHIRKFQCKELILNNGTALRVSEKNYAEQKKKYLLWKGWQ